MRSDQSAWSAGALAIAPEEQSKYIRSSQYPLSTSPSTASLGTMATTGFLPQPQAFRPAFSLNTALAQQQPVGTPFSTHPPASPARVLIRRLPLNSTQETVALMFAFSEELIDIEILPFENSEDAGFLSAVARLRTVAGAMQAKDLLDGRPNISKDAELIVEVLASSPNTARRQNPDSGSANNSSAASSAASSATGSRQTSRFNGVFPPMERFSPPLHNGHTRNELPTPNTLTDYQNLFSPQSPIGNHLTERARMSGKTLIAHDTANDDETSDLIKDPVAWAESEPTAQPQRRATAPQIPSLSGRMAGLSLNTNNTSPAPPSVPYMNSMSAHTAVSPMNGSAPGLAYPIPNGHYQRSNYPAANPADQNPPCNTLYVGNLPADTSEEELKAMFSKQRGYKRLCFRTKQNGPMCFVEFEDVSFATKALNELYGTPLHNSVKGGIRLSFSKNPLGVRSGQATSQGNSGSMSGINGSLSGHSHAFTTANGPPPGLPQPGNSGSGRGPYQVTSPVNAAPGHHFAVSPFQNANPSWGNSVYNGEVQNNFQRQAHHSLPPHMMGR